MIRRLVPTSHAGPVSAKGRARTPLRAAAAAVSPTAAKRRGAVLLRPSCERRFSRAQQDCATTGNARSSARAFTLIEILLVLALLALVAAVFVPGVNSILRDINDRGPDQLLSEAVLAARAEALETGRTVELAYVKDSRQFVWGARASHGDALPKELVVEILPVATGSNILLGGELAEVQEPLKRVRFFPDGTCEPFRLRVKSGENKPRTLIADPWTCALSPAPAKGTP